MSFHWRLLLSVFVVFSIRARGVDGGRKERQAAGGFSFQGSQGCSPPTTCSSLSTCTALADRARQLTPSNIEFLKSITCGFEGSAPRVCCPPSEPSVVTPVEPAVVTPVEPAVVTPVEPVVVTPVEPAVPRQSAPACGVGGFALTRVVGGKPADLGDWPWAVAIFVDNSAGQPELSCGGTVINDEYILTAAHCIVSQSNGGKQIPASSFSIRLGDLDLNRDDDGAHPVIIRVSEARAHANFDLGSFHNDIGLLKLAKPIPWTEHIKPVCMPTTKQLNETFERKGSVLVGWGTIGFEKAPSAHLQYVQFPVQPQAVCEKSYAPFRASHPIIRSQLCAGVLTGKKDACQGDSGGPLVTMDPTRQGSPWIIVGVVSYGLRCAEPGFPGIYTRVTAYLDWIETNTQ